MKSKVFTLSNVFLKNSFQTQNKKQASPVKMAILYIFLFIYLGGVFGFMSYGMIDGLIALRPRASIP